MLILCNKSASFVYGHDGAQFLAKMSYAEGQLRDGKAVSNLKILLQALELLACA